MDDARCKFYLLMTYLYQRIHGLRTSREEIAFTALAFNAKFLGKAEAYFVCHIGPILQISLIYAFIGCP